MFEVILFLITFVSLRIIKKYKENYFEDTIYSSCFIGDRNFSACCLFRAEFFIYGKKNAPL